MSSGKTKLAVMFVSIAFLLSISIVFSQTQTITLSVFPSAGLTSDQYEFKITWDTSIWLPTWKEPLELQYKKSTDSTWKIFAPHPLTLVDTAQAETRKVTITPSDKIATDGTYNFRIIKTDDLQISNVKSITFNDDCGRKDIIVSLTLLPGTGYKVLSGDIAQFSVDTGNSIGSGKKVSYELEVTNMDIGCGSSNFRVEVLGDGVDTGTDPGTYIYTVSPSSEALIGGPGGSFDFQIEVTAADEIGSSAVPEGAVTFRVTNVDSLKEASPKKLDKTVRITVDVLGECVRKDPLISLSPSIREGYAGDKVRYSVKVENRNTGSCDAEEFTVNQVGVQRIKDDDGTYKDDSWRWSFVVDRKGYSVSSIISSFPSGSNTYSKITHSITPFKFTLGNSDDVDSNGNCVSCEKKFNLYVTSYTGDIKFGPRIIALCTSSSDHGTECGSTASYELLNPTKSKSDSIEVNTDKEEAYNSGETVKITGKLSLQSGSVKDLNIEIEVLGTNDISLIKTTTISDNLGSFSHDFPVDPDDITGDWKVIARYQSLSDMKIIQVVGKIPVSTEIIKDVVFPTQATVGQKVTFKWKLVGLDSFTHTNLHCFKPTITNVKQISELTEDEWTFARLPDHIFGTTQLQKTTSNDYSADITVREEGKYYCRVHVDKGNSNHILSPEISSKAYEITVTKSISPTTEPQQITVTKAPSGTIEVGKETEFGWKADGITTFAHEYAHTNIHCYTKIPSDWRKTSPLAIDSNRITVISAEYSDSVKFSSNTDYYCRIHASDGVNDENSPLSTEIYEIKCADTTCDVTKTESSSDAGGGITEPQQISITVTENPTSVNAGENIVFKWTLTGLEKFLVDNAHTNLHCFKDTITNIKPVNQLSDDEWIFNNYDYYPTHLVNSQKINTKADSYEGNLKADDVGKYYCRVHATADDVQQKLSDTFTIEIVR